MKKFVRESLNFERGKDPKDSMGILNDALLSELEGLGVVFDFEYVFKEDGIKEKNLFSKNVKPIYDLIKKLIDVGVDPKDVEIDSHNSISILTYEIRMGNQILMNTLTEEDASFLKDVCQSLSVKGVNQTWDYKKTTQGSLNIRLYLNDNDKIDEFIKNLTYVRKKCAL